jgi:hypothetical protein
VAHEGKRAHVLVFVQENDVRHACQPQRMAHCGPGRAKTWYGGRAGYHRHRAVNASDHARFIATRDVPCVASTEAPAVQALALRAVARKHRASVPICPAIPETPAHPHSPRRPKSRRVPRLTSEAVVSGTRRGLMSRHLVTQRVEITRTRRASGPEHMRYFEPMER